MAAELQQITYREYLPNVLGSEAFGDLGDRDTTYNPHVDPSILNEFATVAFRSDSYIKICSFLFFLRFGHSTVADTFNGVDPWPLAKHFFE